MHRLNRLTRSKFQLCWNSESASKLNMEELVFLIEAAPEGGFTARALGASIFTEADDRGTLKKQVLDALGTHFEPDKRPRLVCLHFVQDEVVAV